MLERPGSADESRRKRADSLKSQTWSRCISQLQEIENVTNSPQTFLRLLTRLAASSLRLSRPNVMGRWLTNPATSPPYSLLLPPFLTQLITTDWANTYKERQSIWLSRSSSNSFSSFREESTTTMVFTARICCCSATVSESHDLFSDIILKCKYDFPEIFAVDWY